MNVSQKKPVFSKIPWMDVYVVLVTLAYVLWRARVFWQRTSG